MTAGAELRDRGHRQLDLASLWDPWPERADAALEYLARTGREFTAEDVRAMVGDPDRPGAMGGRLLAAAKKGLIERVGFRQAERSERRSGWLAVWRGCRSE
jgi:hypothetical protein